MLVAPAADSACVISGFLRLTALVCCALIVLSFALFARDQMAGASAHQESELVAGTGATAAASATSKRHGQPRRFIDGAARLLTRPFDAIVQSTNQWVKRGLPTLFAMILYGVGLGYLARHLSVHGS
jgi:hypothetical protein